MTKDAATEICRRIAELRAKAFGPRGKLRFAKQLGLSASTYDYYEGSRTPPAEVLVRIAEVTGADLHWLLTGVPSATPLSAEDHPVLRRAAALLADCPDAAGPLDAFVSLLMETRKFPAKPQVTEIEPVATESMPAVRQPPVPASPQRQPEPPPIAPAHPGREGWIPILGRTAAGIARFWGKDEDVSGLTSLAELIARQAAWRSRSVRPATAAEDEIQTPAAVQLITLSAPDERDTAEYVSAGTIKRRHGDAFALRVDGDSMAPDILPGDVVILSPSVAAEEGRAAVVQLAGQIGVTCKLYRISGGRVHLVPANGNYEIATVPAGQVDWALRVLARVRG